MWASCQCCAFCPSVCDALLTSVVGAIVAFKAYLVAIVAVLNLGGLVSTQAKAGSSKYP